MRFVLPLLVAFSCWAQPDPTWKKLIAVPGLNLSLLSGLLLEYRFESQIGTTTITDYSGHNNNGVSTANNWAMTPGVSGVSQWCYTNAAFTQGIGSGNITYGTNQITVTYWIYPKGSPFATAWITFESSDNFGNHNNTYIVDWSSANGVEVGLHGTGANFIRDYVPPVANVWTHYAVLFDASTSAGLVTVYTNHVLQTQSSTPANNANFSGNFGTFPVNVMCRNQSGGLPTLGWLGAIDDFRIYPGLLTSNQIYIVFSTPL